MICRREIEQLKAAIHGRVTSVDAAGLVRIDRAVHLASNVGELLDQA